MSLFTRWTDALSTYLSPHKKPNTARSRSPLNRSRPASLTPHVDSDTIVVQLKNTRKRKAPPLSTESVTKKFKLTVQEEKDDLEGSTLLTATPQVSHSKKESLANPKVKADRELMPPPSSWKRGLSFKTARSPQVKYPELPDLEAQENKSPYGETSSRRIRIMSSPIDPESMSPDLKERYQAAMMLPENSGIWAEAERDLFFRLALRGFEPLLPPNWMLDFPTYPLALYSSENSPPPLLQFTSGNDFRATKALKELNEMGKRVRDRALSSPSSSSALRSEPIINATVSRYINLALIDAKVHPSQRSAALPVHVITNLQKKQSTHDAITAMTAQLHDLAVQHRERHGIRASVERNQTPASDETHVLEDDEDLPILTGIMICSSIVVVVTLNAHAVSTESVSAEETLDDAKDESGLRFIATFDFSEGGMDVWNALAVAIVAMHIRKMMLLQYDLARKAGECNVGGTWEYIEAENVEDDPDA